MTGPVSATIGSVLAQLLDPDLSLRVALTLLHFLWQGVALAAAAALACALMRRASPAARYNVLLGALGVMALCPVVTFVVLDGGTLGGGARVPAPGAGAVNAMPAPDPGRVPARKGSSETRTNEVALGGMVQAREDTADESAAPKSNSASGVASGSVDFSEYAAQWLSPDRLERVAPWVTVAYLLGALLMTSRLALALQGGQRLRRDALHVTEPHLLAALRRRAAQLGLRRVPALAWCARCAAPAVVGVARPMVLLPVALSTGMTAAQIEAILAHELAHVRRLDPLVNLLQGLVEALLFFHPAVWFVSRRLRAERENCCDDMVLAAGSAPLDYVKSLVRAAELGLLSGPATSPAGAALAAVGSQSQLRQRIIRLLQGEPAPQLRVSPAPLLVLVLLAAVVSTAAWHHRARAQEAAAVDDKQAPSTFTGRLLDEHDRPIAFAYIYPEGTNLSRDSARSDLAGLFTLKDVRPEQKRWVVWAQSRSRRTAFTLPENPQAEPFPLRVLHGEIEVEGRVVDADGHPVPNVPVWAHVTLPDKVTYRFKGYSNTGADGYYTLGDLPGGAGVSLQISLSEDPAGPESLAPLTLEPVQKRATYELPDLKTARKVGPPAKPPTPRVRFSGRVVDDDGKPIPGAVVYMSYPKNSMISSAGRVLTDAQGRFTRLLPSDAENVQFRLSHPDHISYHFAERSETAPVAALKDGGAVIVMKRGLAISGVVKDAAGKPVSDAFILAGRLYSRTPSPESETIEDTTTFRTAADGRFRIGGLPPGWRDVTVVGHTFAPVLTRIEARPDAPPAEVVVQPGVSYAGRIVDPAGKPVEGARIGADEWVVGGQQLRAGTRVTSTDADGRFALHHLPKEGRLEMYVGKAPYLGMSFNWSAQGDAPKQLTMCPEPVVRGKVIDAETGAPIKDAMAHPWWGKNPHPLTFDRSVKTGDDGAFELKIQRVSISAEGPPPFFAKVIARGYVPQMSPAVFPDKPSSEPMTIRLEKGEPVGGTVVDAEGNPLAGAQVMLVKAHQNAHVQGHKLNDDFGPAPDPVATTDRLGFFELPPGKAPGRLLVLHEKGYMVLPYPGFNPGDKVAVLPWAKVEGVARKDGKPLHGAVATLNPTNDRGLFGINIHFQLRAATHTDGKFAFDKVPSLPFNVAINQGEQQTQGPEITPPPGETTTVEVGGPAAQGVG